MLLLGMSGCVCNFLLASGSPCAASLHGCALPKILPHTPKTDCQHHEFAWAILMDEALSNKESVIGACGFGWMIIVFFFPLFRHLDKGIEGR